MRGSQYPLPDPPDKAEGESRTGRGEGAYGSSPAQGEGESELSPEDELWIAFGRAVGFTIAAIVLLVGGGIALILFAAAFFRFLYGG